MANREERVILDPAEVAVADRDELNLHDDNIRVLQEGIDWGDTAIEAFMAQQQMGEVPVDYRLPNRTITLPLILGATGDFDAARIALQAKVARINEEGGWLKRELLGGSYGEAGGHLFCDIVKATLKYGGSTLQASQGFDPDVELVLEALPDFYGDLIELNEHEATGDIAWTEQISGNLPGRVDLAVIEESNNDQYGLGWHFRCRNYSAASTAARAYEAEALTPLDLAAVAELSGASGGKAIRHNSLTTGWTPVLSTNLSGAYLTHTGIYDVWARVYTTSEEKPWLRLLYDVGDMAGPAENAQVQVPGKEGFYLVNLGQINLRNLGIGTHRWQGVIQARGPLGGENIYIDRLWLFCADESSGILSGSVRPVVGLNGYKARDGFNQSAGALNGKELPDGSGKWKTEGSEKGDFETTGSGLLKRTAKEDTLPGRVAQSPTAELSVIAAQVSFQMSSLPLTAGGGSITPKLRFSTAENSGLRAIISLEPEGTSFLSLFGLTFIEYRFEAGVWYTLTALLKGGKFAAGWIDQGVTTAIPNRPPDLAAPVTTAKGIARIVDTYTGKQSITRTYDNFSVWVPDLDAVAYAERTLRLTTEGAFRQSADGLAFGTASYVNSDLPRIPVSGPEERPVEIAIKASRGDFATLPDGGIDAIAAQLSYRPCWSYVPEP